MDDSLLEKALAAKRESKQIEFKEAFNVASKQDWCEITKDVVAIANSGGGLILFGVNSQGAPIGTDLTALRAVDPATIADHIQPYTGTQIADLEVTEASKLGHKLLAWLVGPAGMPMVFGKPGTYPVEGGKQNTAFSRGTIYFRHGAKSEPGTTEDIARALERKLESIRKDWLSGVRKVVHAPAGSRVTLLPPERPAIRRPGCHADPAYGRSRRSCLSDRRPRQHTSVQAEGVHLGGAKAPAEVRRLQLV